MKIEMPLAPIKPNYEEIINVELRKFEEKTVISLNQKEKMTIKIRNVVSPYVNPAYNAAIVEAFETSVQSRIKASYFQYLKELDEYEIQLRQYLDELSKIKTKHKKQIELLRIDFDTVKKFYDNFQELTKSKFSFISEVVKSVLTKDKSEKGEVADENENKD